MCPYRYCTLMRHARDPKRPKRVAYLVTTDLALTAAEVVEAFARRW